MSDCLFCRIIAKEIPALIVAETEQVIAFLDIHPVHPGHTLIVPKKHVATLMDAEPESLASWIAMTQRVARSLSVAVQADGVNLEQNNGSAAGQVIPHLHMHVIPRFKEDGLRPWPGQAVETAVLQPIAAAIRKAIQL